jgi:glycosyltransferase involved in cell wall biosynthesis
LRKCSERNIAHVNFSTSVAVMELALALILKEALGAEEAVKKAGVNVRTRSVNSSVHEEMSCSVFTSKPTKQRSLKGLNFILIATGIFSSKIIGGGDVVFVEIGKHLVEIGANVTVITSKAGEKLCRGAGLEAHFWIIDDEEVSRIIIPRLFLIWLKRAIKASILLAKTKFNKMTLIVSTSDLFFENIPLLFVKDRSVKRISIFHMVYPIKNLKLLSGKKIKMLDPMVFLAYLAYFQQMLTIWVLKQACDIVFALSNTLSFLRNRGIPANRIVTFDQGVSQQSIHNVIVEGKMYDCCWIGRYSPRKGIEDLITIWKLVCRRKSNATLIIMGSAAYDHRLKSLISNNQIEQRVKLEGFVSDDKKFKILKETKIFLFPSFWEGWPIVVCEALACGLPVIAYDLPVYRVFTGGIVRVPLADKESFAREVLALLEDEDKLKRLSVEAEATGKHYSWERVFEKFDRVLEMM